MTEFNSKVSKNEYEIIFKTDKWSDYTEVQEAIRGIIDRNKSQRVPQNTDICICCGAEIPEGRQICIACERSVYGKDL